MALAALKASPGAALAAGQSTPPFYLLTRLGRGQALGRQEWAPAPVLRLRSRHPAGLWRLARPLAGVPASLLALAVVAFSPIMVYYSKELKQYSGDAFFAVLVFYLAERLRASGGRRGWTGPGPGRPHRAWAFPIPWSSACPRRGSSCGSACPRPAARLASWAASGSWPSGLIISCSSATRWTRNWWPIGPRTIRISPAWGRLSAGWGAPCTVISGISWESGGPSGVRPCWRPGIRPVARRAGPGSWLYLGGPLLLAFGAAACTATPLWPTTAATA